MSPVDKPVPTDAAEIPRPLEQILLLYRKMPYSEYLRSPHWLMVREMAMVRSSRKCQLCAAVNRLEAHHNTYIRRGGELPEDVVVLCHKCHSRHHSIGLCKATDSFRVAGIDRPVECILAKNHADNHQHSNGLFWNRVNGNLTFYKEVEDSNGAN